MIPDTDLYKLVLGMTAAERRGFRIYATRYGDQKNYLVLFDAILKVGKTEEEEVKGGILSPAILRNFASEKRKLMRQVEQFLSKRLQETTLEGRLRLLLLEAAMLRGRKFYKRATRKLNEAEKIARLFDKPLILLEINSYRKGLEKERKSKWLGKQMEGLLEQADGYLDDLSEQLKYEKLYDRLSVLMREEFNSRSERVRERVEMIFQMHPELDQSPPEGYAARRLFHLSRAIWFQLRGLSGQEFEEYSAVVSLMEANPDRIRLARKKYYVAITNLLHAAQKTKRMDLFPSLLDRVRQFPPQNAEEAGEFFQGVQFYELVYLLNHGRLEAVLDKLPELESGFRKHWDEINISRRIAFNTNLGFTFFYLERFSKSKEFFEKILLEKTTHRKDLQQLARIMEVVLFFELGKFDLCEFRCRAAMENLRRKQQLLPLERTVLKAIGELVALESGCRKEGFERLLESFDILSKNPMEKNSLGLSDLKIWARARANGESLRSQIPTV